MKEQLPNNDIDSLAALDELGELIMKTGVTSEQLVEEHLKEKYAKCERGTVLCTFRNSPKRKKKNE